MSKDYKIGFAKPPKNTQFKKGKSGNPKGRPRKSINTINFMEKEFQSEIQVKEGGNTTILTKQQAIIKQVINQAAKGINAAEEHSPSTTAAASNPRKRIAEASASPIYGLPPQESK